MHDCWRTSSNLSFCHGSFGAHNTLCPEVCLQFNWLESYLWLDIWSGILMHDSVWNFKHRKMVQSIFWLNSDWSQLNTTVDMSKKHLANSHLSSELWVMSPLFGLDSNYGLKGCVGCHCAPAFYLPCPNFCWSPESAPLTCPNKWTKYQAFLASVRSLVFSYTYSCQKYTHING